MLIILVNPTKLTLFQTIQTSIQPTVSNQNQFSSQSNGSTQPTWGPSRYSQAGNKMPGHAGMFCSFYSLVTQFPCFSVS